MDPEFIPATIVLGFALLMAVASIVLARRELRGNAPDEWPEAGLTMADLEAEWATCPAVREEALHAKPYNVEQEGL
jgi:hypothetical protein